MIELHDILVKIAEYKEQIATKIKHSYLAKYFETPSIDDDKILLLISIYEDTQIPEEKIENYIITTMLVQLALDTHEVVPSMTVRNSSAAFKNQQLTVLAGDFYSGLYYYFLAGSNDISYIRILAEGIKDVNENKINVYHKDIDQIDKLFYSIQMIETSIMRKITELFYQKKYDGLITKFLLLKRLLHEREQFVSNGESVVFEVLQKVSENEQKAYLLHEFDKYVEDVKNSLESIIYTNSDINKLLVERIKDLIYQNHLGLNKIVEEG